MAKTKKVKSAGKFGTRYGMKARRRYAGIDGVMRRSHECPSCSRLSVKRISTAIWGCRKCGTRFIGGAYLPKTSMAKDSERIFRNIITEG